MIFRLTHWVVFFAAIAASIFSVPAFAQTPPAMPPDKPFLHALFSDNAVLQRNRVIPVWGWTVPGESVQVKLDAKATTARADALGRWMAHIGPYPAGGPHTLSVSTLSVSDADPSHSVTRKNVLFGDVWLCSGQSNMEFGVGNLTNAQEEIDAANYPQIRLFTVPKRTATEPVHNVNSGWLVCNPTNIKQGAWNGFSAVAYFFGRKLHQELKIPIGLVHSSWGGTVAEAWVSESSLGTLPDFKEAIAASKRVNDAAGIPLDQRINTWLATYDPTLKTNWAMSEGDDSNWKAINLPGSWENSGVPELADFDGIVLFRHEIDVPAEWAGKDLTLALGGIDDNDVTYWNGVPVGATNGWTEKRAYKIPGAQVKAGLNLVAVRVTDNSGAGGFYGAASDMKLVRDGANSIAVNGIWKYRIAVPLDKMATMPRDFNPNDPNQVNVLYNGMIAPLEPYGITGAIWYQGESNADRSEQYSRLLPALIRDWRTQFNTPLPFYIVQLAGFMAPDDAPKNDAWPRLRAEQAKTAQTVPNTGIAITTDIGDEKDIHPKNKQDVGLRLGLLALARTYGHKTEYSGPIAQSVTPEGERLVINFDHASGGLVLKGDATRVFAVAGADRNWFWATPRIEGRRVILTCPVVSRPLYVRYGWSNLPRATLYNRANLPAPPFQTLP